MSPDEFRELLRSKGASTECPACGAEDWRGLDDVIDLPVRVAGATHADTHVRIPGFEALAPSCGRCGYVRLLDLRLLEAPVQESSEIRRHSEPARERDAPPPQTDRPEEPRPSRQQLTNIWGDPVSKRKRRDR